MQAAVLSTLSELDLIYPLHDLSEGIPHNLKPVAEKGASTSNCSDNEWREHQAACCQRHERAPDPFLHHSWPGQRSYWCNGYTSSLPDAEQLMADPDFDEGLWRCCQTNSNSSPFAFQPSLQIAPSWRHSARAAARKVLKLPRL